MSEPELSPAGDHFGRAFCVPEDKRTVPLSQLTPDEAACVRKVGIGWEERTAEKLGFGVPAFTPAPPSPKAECGLCGPTLESGCRMFGEPYCGILDRWRTDPAFSADDALLALAVEVPAAQREAIAADLRSRGVLPGTGGAGGSP